VTLMAAGSMLLLVGWIAYLVLATQLGSKADLWRTALNVIIASAAGTATAMLYCARRFGKPDVALAFVGLISGAVGVSAGAALLPVWAAALLGAVCGVVGPWFSIWTDIRLRIDDATGLTTAVGASAVVSGLGSALLVTNTLGMRLTALGMNALGIALAILLSAGVAMGLMAIFAKRMKIRVSEADEYDGLDLAEHDVNAYPDFQQTMIKSHHLRQA
jgi:Amt family ammonium transporter